MWTCGTASHHPFAFVLGHISDEQYVMCPFYRFHEKHLVMFAILKYGQLSASLRPYRPALVLHPGFVNCTFFLRANKTTITMNINKMLNATFQVTCNWVSFCFLATQCCGRGNSACASCDYNSKSHNSHSVWFLHRIAFRLIQFSTRNPTNKTTISPGSCSFTSTMHRMHTAQSAVEF